MRDRHYQQTYGLTLAEREEMIEKQDGCCAICGFGFCPEVRPHTDHCHDTGAVRGILCQGCNTGLGYFREDPKRLRAAIEYLESVMVSGA
jgi:Autographiviridae endonuclease VII